MIKKCYYIDRFNSYREGGKGFRSLRDQRVESGILNLSKRGENFTISNGTRISIPTFHLYQ